MVIIGFILLLQSMELFYCKKEEASSINIIKTIKSNVAHFSGSPKNNYIPLSFNQAGVMPIILTTAVLVIPNYMSNLGLLPIITLPAFVKSSKLFIGLVILY